MKRASLRPNVAPAGDSIREDVTDRLLGGQASTPMAPAHGAGRGSRRKSRLSPGATGESRTEAADRSPTPLIPPAISIDDPTAAALALTRQALDALRAAQGSGPARYELGIRYRLDALAHHLEQVSQFILHQAG